MAESENKQVRPAFEAEKRSVVNVTQKKNEIALARRSAIICRGYNHALRHRIAQGAS